MLWKSWNWTHAVLSVISGRYQTQVITHVTTYLPLKHTSGSIMLWDFFSVSKWNTCKERFNNEWSQVQKNSSAEPAKYLGFGWWCVFQDDSDPKHRTRLNLEWVQNKIIKRPWMAEPRKHLKLILKCVEWLEDNCSDAPYQI